MNRDRGLYVIDRTRAAVLQRGERKEGNSPTAYIPLPLNTTRLCKFIKSWFRSGDIWQWVSFYGGSHPILEFRDLRMFASRGGECEGSGCAPPHPQKG